MQYYYPINADSAEKMQSLMSQRPEFPPLFDGMGILFWLSLGIVVAFVSLFTPSTKSEKKHDGYLFPTLVCILFLAVFIVSSVSALSHKKWEENVLEVAKLSFEDESNYQEFQNTAMRYLEKENIDLIKNCETSPVPDSMRDNYYMTYPINNILCDVSEERFSGEVVFLDENNVVKNFSYETSLNENGDHLIFSMKGTENNEV